MTIPRCERHAGDDWQRKLLIVKFYAFVLSRRARMFLHLWKVIRISRLFSTDKIMNELIQSAKEPETHQQRNLRVFSRWSVFDLREQSVESLQHAEQMLIDAQTDIEIESRGASDNLISWFRVRSNGNLYEVRRFENWCFCSCAAFFFFFGKSCRHIAITFPPICAECGKRQPSKHGEMCRQCQEKNAPYLKLTVNKKTERVGKVRI